MRKYFMLSEESIAIELKVMFKGIEDRCVVTCARDSLITEEMIILKGIDSPISQNGTFKKKEINMLTDAVFDKNLNKKLLEIFSTINVVNSIDCTQNSFTNNFQQELDETDINILELIKEDLDNIGILEHCPWIEEKINKKEVKDV